MTVALAALAKPANAYDEKLHSLLDERALPSNVLDTVLPPVTIADVAALRVAIWHTGATYPDPDVRRRFLLRYPNEDGFDAWAFKELLGLTPELAVVGIDTLPEFSRAPTIRDVLSGAARAPDEDRRNQERFAHDDARRIRLDVYGQPLPADPAQLDMGARRGLSSQAYAHYGLRGGPKSDSADVLKKDPSRFAYPPTARAFAADFAQEYTDLAIAAANLPTPGAATLGWLYLGNSHHYIEDVANQIHTLQAVYGFFYDAKIESLKEELRSVGGLFRSRPDFVTIGIRIIQNHHVLVEHLWSKRILEAVAGQRVPVEVAEGLDAITRGDGALEQAIDARQVALDADFGRVIAEEVIEASAREGGEIYEIIHGLALPSLSRLGGIYDDPMDPDAFLRKGFDAEKLSRFYRLEGAGFGRAGSAIRRHVQMYQARVDLARKDDESRQAVFEAAARRLVRTQLDALDAREARLAGYVPRPPDLQTINWWIPTAMVGTLLLVIVLPMTLIVRRMRRRRRLRRSSAA